MLKINKGEPWVMWPDNIVKNFIEFPANKIFDYDGNFEFYLIFELIDEISEKSTLFSKLPSYFGFDLEKNGFTFIISDLDGNLFYFFKEIEWNKNKKYKILIKKEKNILLLNINDNNKLIIELEKPLSKDDNSHIIFGSGNFPKNNYNLNFLSCVLHEMIIKKEDEIICHHNFIKNIHNKMYDITGNCNFLNKI